MSKPFERNRLKRRYLYFGIGSYALIVLFFCHWGHLSQAFPDLSGASLALEAVNHLVFHPFQFIPFDTAYLAYGMLIGLIAPLMIQTEYLRRRDLRPAIENGSARWNENLSDYQKRYVSTPLLGTGSPNMIFAQQLYLSMMRLIPLVRRFPGRTGRYARRWRRECRRVPPGILTQGDQPAFRSANRISSWLRTRSQF